MQTCRKTQKTCELLGVVIFACIACDALKHKDEQSRTAARQTQHPAVHLLGHACMIKATLSPSLSWGRKTTATTVRVCGRLTLRWLLRGIRTGCPQCQNSDSNLAQSQMRIQTHDNGAAKLVGRRWPAIQEMFSLTVHSPRHRGRLQFCECPGSVRTTTSVRATGIIYCSTLVESNPQHSSSSSYTKDCHGCLGVGTIEQ